MKRSYRFVPTEEVRESLDYAFKATAQKLEAEVAFHEYEWTRAGSSSPTASATMIIRI